MAAVVTLLEMAAENCGPTDLDRGHNTALRYRKRSAMLSPELEVLWWSGLGLGGNWLWE